ncbi:MULTISPECIES: hypothetical protein [unclassified Bradyrhizobium]|uniref:hypothetical protein n=1 Tax=unclassified Bradyrhizobium TaxID=2631580 RepID=UPI00247A59E0|nr:MULTISPECIES: hypothetical protein [unclassified Bradyrhizobium]WGS18970.1 hypothetical protein MTX22_31345 [Bradyrhizobium sp. ISRA463]WGS25804.1 hypothetical protein MTX19_28910 [Bradyrhizobium sp. ISRA464]
MLTDASEFATWLRPQPLQWSTVIAVRASLRILPASQLDQLGDLNVLSIFRANSLARFSAKHPNDAVDLPFVRLAVEASTQAASVPSASAQSASAAARVAAEVAKARITRTEAASAHSAAANAVSEAFRAAAMMDVAAEFLRAVTVDIERLQTGASTFEQLADEPPWPNGPPAKFDHWWQRLSQHMLDDGDHWEVWISWYEALLHGPRMAKLADAAVTDVPGDLPWDQGAEAVNAEIERRLWATQPDPVAVEGIVSPITINRLPNGRIGTEPGSFSLPTLPPSFTSGHHRDALMACRSRALQLAELASSPKFQSRSDYAQILTAYVEWLPTEIGTGNMLLADGEARTLNKLFTADEPILSPAFASKLAVLLEDHIGLRSFYPEIEKHYHAVSIGRLVKPLARDAVEAIQRIIHAQTPEVFDETLSPAIDEATKPEQDFKALPAEDLPPADATRPKPPKDPIADADPQKSRSYIIASAFNRIWWILQKGKETAQAAEGWRRTYHLLRPHIGPIIDFLRDFGSGGHGGGPPLPPTIGA